MAVSIAVAAPGREERVCEEEEDYEGDDGGDEESLLRTCSSVELMGDEGMFGQRRQLTLMAEIAPAIVAGVGSSDAG